MTTQSEVDTAIDDLRVLATEPGIHIRWQERIASAIAALEGARQYVPVLSPEEIAKQQAEADEKAKAEEKSSAKPSKSKSQPDEAP
jgi:hypothetical protein